MQMDIPTPFDLVMIYVVASPAGAVPIGVAKGYASKANIVT